VRGADFGNSDGEGIDLRRRMERTGVGNRQLAEVIPGRVFAPLVRALLVLTMLGGCSHAPSAPTAGLESISGDRMLQDIRTLSSDEYGGRGPGSKGEELAIGYIQKQFRDAGLEPGNPDGTYLQNVPLVGITPDKGMALDFTGHGETLHAMFSKDFVAWTKRMVDESSVDADMVFAGYGVQAPEYNWDDFKGVDVKGKVIVVLINDPPVADQTIFGGKTMTYYGRWTYKYEKAAELGAAGCLIVHQIDRAGYPWDVVASSWGGEQFALASANNNMDRMPMQGWLTHDQAEQLFRASGHDLGALEKAAVDINFHPVDLGIKAKISIHNTQRTIASHNVIAKRTGSDDKLKNQYVIYTAHWDHFGIGPEVNGDRIYHGALDNASGVAALLDLSRAYEKLKFPPARTILFIAVTGEEQGLLGSEYYAEHPLYPLARTAANINMDGMNLLGRTHDITIVGNGKSNLDAVVTTLAHSQGRVVNPDPQPEKGFYFRSDHFSFAKAGVPAFDPNGGIDYIGKPQGWGMEMRKKYIAEDYHKPSDVIKPYWDMSGAAEDCQLYFLVGYRVANDPKMPEWAPKSEFKAARDASQRQAQ
jgi:Zn-dependent M28 family amino/carboxypeptidase